MPDYSEALAPSRSQFRFRIMRSETRPNSTRNKPEIGEAYDLFDIDPYTLALIGVGLLTVFIALGVHVVFAAALVGIVGLLTMRSVPVGTGSPAWSSTPRPPNSHLGFCRCSF